MCFGHKVPRRMIDPCLKNKECHPASLDQTKDSSSPASYFPARKITVWHIEEESPSFTSNFHHGVLQQDPGGAPQTFQCLEPHGKRGAWRPQPDYKAAVSLRRTWKWPNNIMWSHHIIALGAVASRDAFYGHHSVFWNVMYQILADVFHHRCNLG